MKIYPKHKGKVYQGKLVLFNEQLFNTHLRCLEGKHVDVTIKLPSKHRSLPQNNRHWARMTLAAEMLNDRTPSDLHYDFCAALLVDRTKSPPRVRTSSELTTVEFSRFEEDIDNIMNDLGMPIPEPEDVELSS